MDLRGCGQRGLSVLITLEKRCFATRGRKREERLGGGIEDIRASMLTMSGGGNGARSRVKPDLRRRSPGKEGADGSVWCSR
jgi:hypothetical protein